jgi:hypothetical protein
MTRDEAERLADIFIEVDSGCCVCVAGVCAQANEQKFGFWWNYVEATNERAARIEVFEGDERSRTDTGCACGFADAEQRDAERDGTCG